MKKKIIIVNNNMKVGGVQKSLYNLLWEIKDDYDVTLFLFEAIGAYMEKLPDEIRVIKCNSFFRFLGMSQDECKYSSKDYLTRGVLSGIAKLFGRHVAMRIILASQKNIDEEFDCAISFLHNGKLHQLYGGTNEFVLNKIKAKKKVAFLHCDYGNCGADNVHNNSLYKKFDVIAACSNGCRMAFLDILPEFKDKCCTVENFNRYDEIIELANKKTIVYDDDVINLITVARLGREKAVERGILALDFVLKNGCKANYHIVGDGRMLTELKQMVANLGLEKEVVFYGEQSNPYPYMARADLFLLTSYHEAAPMVLNEARCLNLPVLAVETISANEMVAEKNSGWVCANDQDSLNKSLLWIMNNSYELMKKKEDLHGLICNNDIARQQFMSVVDC